jgi:crossover junction endodeoxyribonuclease RuvC
MRFGSKILAVDPGLEGAFAIFGHENEFLVAAELPRFERKRLNGVALTSIVAEFAPQHFVIEDVGPMPKQGVVSVFTFGFACGMIAGVACGTGSSIHYVRPNRWKAHFRLNGRPKDASRECAIRLYPEAASSLVLKRHHGRADAILLARFFLDTREQGKFV